MTQWADIIVNDEISEEIAGNGTPIGMLLTLTSGTAAYTATSDFAWNDPSAINSGWTPVTVNEEITTEVAADGTPLGLLLTITSGTAAYSTTTAFSWGDSSTVDSSWSNSSSISTSWD